MLANYRHSDRLTGMNWIDLLEELRRRGWTQARLSERLGISQSAVSELQAGKIKDPRHSTGAALERLHASGERFTPARPAPPQGQEAA